jgi:hypothetical protein
MPIDVAELGQLVTLGAAKESGPVSVTAQPASDATTTIVAARIST